MPSGAKGAPFEGTEPGPADPAILRRLVALYRRLRPDVLCLQEVQNMETFNTLSQSLKLEGYYCPGGKQPQYGGAVFWAKRRIGDAIGPYRAATPANVADLRGAPVGRASGPSLQYPIVESGRTLGPEKAAVRAGFGHS